MRTAAFLIHIAGLALGVFFAIVATDSAFVNLETDSVGVALSRITTAGALILVTAAFLFILVRRGFATVAPVMFGVSYGTLGITVAGISRIIAKDFAPASPDELPSLYSQSYLIIAIAIAVTLAAWIWTYRKSRFPLL
jgi:hypothetical protein